MKRSKINQALKELEAMCAEYRCYLPPFCHFTPEEWKTKGHEYDEVRDCMLGWDITDYGLGDFDKTGFSLITIRNGNRSMADKYPKVYAEKLLYLKEGQYAPNHFHW
ncbi:MAG: D-lyxose/D-mannose family sugar isomerase [Erysipelotrichaceae bacterium]|nr:D-lyxose/D-mannose family sugar isomerase [Erysipelotrichaceae bacterium]